MREGRWKKRERKVRGEMSIDGKDGGSEGERLSEMKMRKEWYNGME